MMTKVEAIQAVLKDWEGWRYVGNIVVCGDTGYAGICLVFRRLYVYGQLSCENLYSIFYLMDELRPHHAQKFPYRYWWELDKTGAECRIALLKEMLAHEKEREENV